MRWLVGAIVAVLAFSGCAVGPGGSDTPKVSVETPWVRSTAGAKDTSMSAAFMTLVNPGNTDVRLVKAHTDVAMMTQLHEMVTENGKKVMREAPNGIVVPAGGHQHLVSGGYHVMLMGLKQELPIGAKVTIDLTFDNGTTLQLVAPVKEFVEEEDHYHSPNPTPSA